MLTSVIALLATPTSGAASVAAESADSRAQASAASVSAPENSLVRALRSTITDRRSATWRHQDYLGYQHTRSAFRERHTTARPYLTWIRGLWAKRAHRHWRLTLVTLRDYQVAPGLSAWRKAVNEAQKPYPGTEAWLLSCSASEGGHGRWVPNSQGSGVGGWMQMFPSTFWRMFSAARADVRARGYRVPASAASWYSPLGQALGGAWAIRNGRRHEWVGSGC